MKQSYLIQRLKKPYKGNTNNPFNFGGGLARGGICKDCYDALNQIFTFDYMGAAEFEFGIIPEVLGRIFRYYADGRSVKGRLCIHGIPVYYLCHEVQKAEVDKRIQEIATGKVRGKERALLDEALASRVPDRVVPEKSMKYSDYKDYIGWLELDNDFIFFLDKEPLENFSKYLDTLKEPHPEELQNERNVGTT
jgi:hypothetical protein